MANFSYLERVEYILEKLLKNESINTTEIAKCFNVDPAQIRSDLNDRIKPLFDKTIKRVGNNWVPDEDLLANQFFTAEQLLIISLLRNVTKDLNGDLYNKTLKLFQSLHETVSDAIYKQPYVEDILETHEEEFHRIEKIIKDQKQISFNYYNKNYPKKVNPLKIVNIERYWYLIAYDLIEEDLRTFYFKGMKDIIDDNIVFDTSEYEFLDKLDYAINAFYKSSDSIDVELELDGKAFGVLNRMKLNPTQNILPWNKETKTAVMHITVTDLMEIAPLIQQWIPHIYVLNPPKLQELIIKNLSDYKI